MNLSEFLVALFEHGRVTVPPINPRQEQTSTDTDDAVLLEYEQAARLEFPGKAPEFHLGAARWSATLFYRACQFAVFREASAEFLRQSLSVPCPDAPAASRHYSVDQVFRFLPDLRRLAASAAEDDPLVAIIDQWAADWPLSSVGMLNVVPRHVDELIADGGLLQAYADCIIARGDANRLEDPRVKEAVRVTVGAHAQLAGELAAALSIV